ncbi:MAG: D-2-hydroxyacid dehydrogenase [Firmicutes bacterium]|nr:D-2-hydroxyacid dehydrogenase [Bacillota bacterium]
MMKAVFLDCIDINRGDLSWEPVENLCEFKWFLTSIKEEAEDRLKDADAVFIDSFPIDRQIMVDHPHLKYIGIAATGFNHVDIKAAGELGVAVTNIPAYSTDAVAQHAIALLLQLTNHPGTYDDVDTTPLTLLTGKSLGIVGYGNIGRRIGEIAEALGMEVIPYSKDPDRAIKADVVSLNCPLTEENRGMVNSEFISSMKDGAILINTARGALVEEQALADALKSGKIAAAGLDVLTKEPPDETCPLLGLENCVITPHIAFTPRETRKLIIDLLAENLKSFQEGGRKNRIDWII